jgi:thiamine-monophosphate kinase
MDEVPPVGEFGLIEWIRRQAKSVASGTVVGIGDDCAVLDFSPGAQVLVTTDMLMDGRHFRLASAGAEAVGYKSLGVNLSDIAAMAGVPRAAVVSVALPRGDGIAIAQGITAGLRRMADKFDVDLVGGDTNAWDGPLVINVALLGETTEAGAVRRSGSRPGDIILVTGPLGGSSFRERHLRPEPRVNEALAIHRAARLSAMIDISDGLSSDLSHILEESGGLGAVLEADQIPIHKDAIEQGFCDSVAPIKHALHDGEDFELCVVCSPDDARKLMDSPPEGCSLFRIGAITPRAGLRIRTADGRIENIQARGFDHFLDATRRRSLRD